jgi:hypothetical protein
MNEKRTWDGKTPKHPKDVDPETITGNIGEYDVPIVYPGMPDEKKENQK